MATVAAKSKAEWIEEILSTPEGKAMSAAAIAEQVGGNVGHVRRIMTEIQRRPPAAEMVSLDRIDWDSGTQMRPDGATAEREVEFAEAMADGAIFPPIEVHEIDGRAVIVDGWTRAAASLRIDATEILAVVYRGGTMDDALLAAVAANSHGTMPRCRETKRNAVRTLLSRPEWADRGIEWLRDTAKVSHGLALEVWTEWQSEAKQAADRAGGEYEPPKVLESRDGRERPAPELVEQADGSLRNRKQLKRAETPTSEIKGRESNGHANGHANGQPLKSKVEPEPAAKLSIVQDEEWLASLFRGKKESTRDRLPPELRRVFDDDALLYRAMAEAPAFMQAARMVRSITEERKVGGGKGVYAQRLSSLFRIKHPRDWNICFGCKGQGRADGCECPECRGRGYKIS